MKKVVPSYWWDFHYPDNKMGSKFTHIKVESSEDSFPVLAMLPVVGDDASLQIIQACAIVADLEAGRITPKSCIKKHGVK